MMPKQLHLYGFASGYKSLRGLEQIIAQLNREVNRIKGATLKGLIRAQIKIRRDMDLVPPKIPVDTGNLRSSYYCTTSDGSVINGQGATFDDKRKDAARLTAGHAMTIAQAGAEAVAYAPKGPAIVFGFSAYYGPYVHENEGANFKREGAGAKFFEAAIKNNFGNVLRIIADNAKVSK